MHSGIQVVSEGSRGCGVRKIGGMYLVFDGAASACGKLPVSLAMLNRYKCPSCGESHELPPDYGIRPSRAPRMLQNPELLWADLECSTGGGMCQTCPLSNGFECGPAMLIWVGETYYQTPEQFLKETREQGISRRIPHVPNGFKVGESWVLLAHTKAIKKRVTVWIEEKTGQAMMIPREEDQYEAGIFAMFKPSRIEKIVSGDEPDEAIDQMIKDGFTPVKVEPLSQQPAEAASAASDEDDLD